MTRYNETHLARHLLYEGFHRLFLCGGRRYVDDSAAGRADEVVVVAGDPLCELESDDSVGSVLRG